MVTDTMIWHNVRHGMSYAHVYTNAEDKPIDDNVGGKTDNFHSFFSTLINFISFEASFTSEEIMV